MRRPDTQSTGLLAIAALGTLAIAAVAPSGARALTCGESGDTPGVIESVLDGTHGRAERWQVIAAGTITSIEPVNGDYGSHGAWIRLDVAYWFRGGNGEPAFTFFDPPAGASGIGFDVGGSYLVLAADDLWNGELATGLCELTHRISDPRLEQLANQFGATMPDTALPSPRSSAWQLVGTVVILLALAKGIRAAARQ